MSVLRVTKLWSLEPGTTAPRGIVPIDTVVVHYTATESLQRVSTAARGLFLAKRAQARKWLEPAHVNAVLDSFNIGDRCSDALALCLIAGTLERKASWHYCVASKPEYAGYSSCEVVEYVQPLLQAHHVGALGLRTNLRSIGIECVYPGAVSHRNTREEAEAIYRGSGWDGDVVKLRGPDGVRRWYVLPDQIQVDTLTALVVRLCNNYPTISAICSHHLFAPTKRTDPDPPYNLDVLRSVVGATVGRPMAAKPPRR